jgi:hypothetical protein
MDPNPIVGKRIALLIAGKDENGGDDWAVFTGTAQLDQGRVVLLRDSGDPVEIEPEWLARVQPVPDGESRRILGEAEYLIPLAVGDIPEGTDSAGYRNTGLKWPEK